MEAAAVVAWIMLASVAYVYAGYPALLWLVTRVSSHPVRRAWITPPVTLVISAFNEAAIIGKKIENCLALDYPADRLEIIVVSDASTDATDAIVKSFGDRSVRLLRLPERQGKTAGLNVALSQASNEIVAFSDANILYTRTAIRCLVRGFADPRVGCVTGDSRYVSAASTAAHIQESSYWSYEREVRDMESRLGSTVGGDGAIFAIIERAPPERRHAQLAKVIAADEAPAWMLGGRGPALDGDVEPRRAARGEEAADEVVPVAQVLVERI